MTFSRKIPLIIFVTLLFLLIAFLSIDFISNIENIIGVTPSIIISLAFGYVFADLWELVTCDYLNLDGGQEIAGYHYHHSMFGVLALIISFAIYSLVGQEVAVLVLFWGIGVIVQHTLSEKKLVFISKKKVTDFKGRTLQG